MYLPDTNVFIRAFLKNKPEITFLKKCLKQQLIVISPIVAAEFLVKANSKEKTQFKNLLNKCKVFFIDSMTAELAAEYRKRFTKRSSRVLMLDCFIAAQAKLHNLTLVTNNKPDFPMKDISVLSPEEI